MKRSVFLLRSTSSRSPVAGLLQLALLTILLAGIAPLYSQTPSGPLLSARQTESLLIGPGDVVSIRILGEPELTQQLRVTDAGDVPALLIGAVHLAGQTPGSAASLIQQQLIARNFLLDPQVSVTVDQFVTQSISVLGQVSRVGSYPAPTGRTVGEIIAQAGGLLDTADRHVVIQRHSDRTLVPFFFSNRPEALFAAQPVVQPGDTVFVPRAGIIYLLGDVGKPGGYAMNNELSELTALQAISLAGGTNNTARIAKARIVRQEPGGPYEIEIHLDKIRKGKIPDMVLQANDILYVPFSYLKNVAVSLPSIVATASSAAIYAVR